MNYQRIYEQLTAKDMIADYTEKHHIIPRCMGGTDDPTNLVRLTPEAHYTAHQLLVKIYPDHVGLVYAAQMMTIGSTGQRVNNKLYGWIKRKVSDSKKGKKRQPVSAETRAKIGASKKGKLLSAETKAKLSAAKQNVSAETRAKLSNASKGKPRSAETRAKMSASKQNMSAETRAKLSAANKGKSQSMETRAKRSAAQKGISQLKIVCPHCNKTGGTSNMKRWHFANCKSLL